MSSPADRLAELLWETPEQGGPPQRYAVLDAARDARVYPLLRWEPGASCLYEGPVASELLEVAPYLLRLERTAPATQELLTRGWGHAWGIFLEASVAPEVVRRHLRKFLKVQDERGERLYFRFYDPRVLRIYLPTCRPDELKAFFGPIHSYVLEDEEGSALLRYSLRDGELHVHRMPVEPSP